PAEVRLLLLRLAPPYGRAAGRARHVLGREHAPRPALQRDDDRDRPRAEAARPVGLRRLMAKIGIFGAGYVGLVTGTCFAELGHEVVLRDVVPERIEELRGGSIPIYEPGLEDLVERNRERMRFTLDVREA